MNNENQNNTGTPSARPKKSLGAMAVILAAIFIVLYIAVNVSAFTEIFSKATAVLTPIILGLAFAYMLNPILKLFEFKIFKKIKNKHVLRGLSLLMTYVVTFAFIAAFLALVLPQLIESIVKLGNNFNSYLEHAAVMINGVASSVLGKAEHELVNEEELLSAITKMIFKSGDLFGDIMGYIVQYGAGLVVGIKNFVLAIFISIYMLAAKERLKAQIKKMTTALFNPQGKRRFYRYVRLCNRTFGGFFVGKIVDSLIIGVITLVVLLIFSMPYSLLVATIVCITNVIPVFGPFIGAIPSFFIILIASDTLTKPLIFLILILLIQQLDGNVIGPKILGDTTGISSLGVIISIVVMGELFGVIGMIVGVPIFAVIIALGKEFIEHRLKKKQLATNTAEYYAADSLVDPHEEHEPALTVLWRNAKQSFIRKKKEGKNKEEKKQETAADATEAPTESESNEPPKNNEK